MSADAVPTIAGAEHQSPSITPTISIIPTIIISRIILLTVIIGIIIAIIIGIILALIVAIIIYVIIAIIILIITLIPDARHSPNRMPGYNGDETPHHAQSARMRSLPLPAPSTSHQL